mmetsp:Transcript_39841/g.158439  ORF Transcript_39841/g.158439 Transcript_39841/m.158439 type:complete len:175 (-) Transcript_39841:1673-2197(-)
MADRKATNKYYPPEYFDEYLEKGGKGGINTFRGEHPLRERAKKLKDGILRVRFEMPFNIWCNGCENHIGKGVRYNADKSKVGNYHSTPIYSFRMKCHLCDNYIEIRTDPQVGIAGHQGLAKSRRSWILLSAWVLPYWFVPSTQTGDQILWVPSPGSRLCCLLRWKTKGRRVDCC